MSVSQTTLAKQLGVSRSSVSHVLNGRSHMVGPETRERILEAVEVAGYHRNALVRALRTNRTNMAGIIVPEERLTFFTDIIRGAERYAQTEGMKCFLCQRHADPRALEKHIENLREYRVDGLLVVPSSQNISPAIFRTLQEQGLPFVLLDNPVIGVEAAFVGTDNRVAGFLATEHLIRLGHRRIVCVQGYEESWASRLRHTGYLQAMSKYDIPIAPDLVLAGGFEFGAGRAAVEKLISTGVDFTGVVVASDTVAMGVIQALHERGWRVPQDVSIVGCGNLDMAAMASPALTTVDQKPEEVGRCAMQLMLQQINRGQLSQQEIIIQPELIIRNSTGTPGTAPR